MGASIVLLMPNEEIFVNFLLKNRGIRLRPHKIAIRSELCAEITNFLRNSAIIDRLVLINDILLSMIFA